MKQRQAVKCLVDPAGTTKKHGSGCSARLACLAPLGTERAGVASYAAWSAPSAITREGRATARDASPPLGAIVLLRSEQAAMGRGMAILDTPETMHAGRRRSTLCLRVRGPRRHVAMGRARRLRSQICAKPCPSYAGAPTVWRPPPSRPLVEAPSGSAGSLHGTRGAASRTVAKRQGAAPASNGVACRLRTTVRTDCLGAAHDGGG